MCSAKGEKPKRNRLYAEERQRALERGSKYYSTVTLEGELLTKQKSDVIIQLVSRGYPLKRILSNKKLRGKKVILYTRKTTIKRENLTEGVRVELTKVKTSR